MLPKELLQAMGVRYSLALSLIHSCCAHNDAVCCLSSGGGVMGSPGRLAALAALEDIQ